MVADEACIIVGAGAETTARTLKLIVYYSTQDLDALSKLRQGLGMSNKAQSKLNDAASLLTRLEALPYLVSQPLTQHHVLLLI
jgi:cytochrome P450